MENQTLPLRPWSQRVGQEEIGEVPSVFGTLSMAFLCEKFPSQHEEKPDDKTSDNFSAENFVLVKSADPIMDAFRNPSSFVTLAKKKRQEPSLHCPGPWGQRIPASGPHSHLLDPTNNIF